MEDYRTGTGQDIYVHSRRVCREDSWCVIHKPMPGPWELWPTHWRFDRRIMERICPHGVGHPVAESWSYLPDYELVHGCCGCQCHPDLSVDPQG